MVPGANHDNERLVAEQYGGILPYCEAFYLESLVYAAGRSVAAFKRFDTAVTRQGSPATIVANVHEALTHAAAASRFFWPARPGIVTEARAQTLAQKFGLDKSSPLFGRSLRNVLEHYDEYLDRFLVQHRVGFFFPGPLVASSELNDDQLGNIFRLVDPETQEFVLLGVKYPFGPLRRAIEKVLDQAQSMSSRGGRLR